MRLGTRHECIGSSLRVSGVCQDGARDSLEEDQDSLEDYRGRFAEGIGKLAGNMPRDRRKKTRRLTARMSEAAGLAGISP
ncbi:hypothetical protein BHM03_00059200 [Ensete ventricosum]|nr:hypothetical protein BHM03_00059200 [Ensete ventricosum]